MTRLHHHGTRRSRRLRPVRERARAWCSSPGAGPFRAVDPITTETAERAADFGVTTVVFDRLGRGESAAEGVLDLDRELAAIAAAIDVAGGRAVLCGHSSGCSLALRAAAAGLPVTGLALWEAPVATDAGRDPGLGGRDRAADRRRRHPGRPTALHEGHAAGVAGRCRGLTGVAVDRGRRGQHPRRRPVVGLGDGRAGRGIAVAPSTYRCWRCTGPRRSTRCRSVPG